MLHILTSLLRQVKILPMIVPHTHENTHTHREVFLSLPSLSLFVAEIHIHVTLLAFAAFVSAWSYVIKKPSSCD
jgi:hypothetical protein